MSDSHKETLRQAALAYHEFPKPGKLEIRATKPLANGRDLARACCRICRAAGNTDKGRGNQRGGNTSLPLHDRLRRSCAMPRRVSREWHESQS